jgi:integrase
MGEHKGWRLRAEDGGWRAYVRIPGKGYRSRNFPGEAKAEARAWAQDEAAKQRTSRRYTPLIGGKAMVATLAVDYLASLTARGRSPAHLRNCRTTLEGVAAVAPDLAAGDAGRALERWLDGMECAPGNRNRLLAEVRAFCRWLMRRDLLERDPTKAIDRASVPDYLRPQFGLDELHRLLTVPDPYRARFALLVYAGLRAGEAAALTWGDVDLAGGVILVRMHVGHRLKRNRERIVPLQPELVQLLGTPGEPGRRATGPSGHNERRDFASYLIRRGVTPQGRSPHACRHTYAGLMTASGVPGPLLSAYLGHTSAATTMLYTKMAARYAQAVTAWPRGRFVLTPAHDVPVPLIPPVHG